MTITAHPRLTAAIAAVKELPEETQEALVEEFSDRIPLLPQTVPSTHIDAIFDRYGQSS